MSELNRINRGVCPTPGKKQYRSQAEANRWQRQKFAGYGNRKERLYAYQCPSGEHWHLTHHTPEVQQTVFDKTTGQPGLVPTSNMFDGHDVRHVFTDQPYWVAKDVCEAAGISKYRDAIVQLDDDERVYLFVDTPGGPQRMVAVTEAGVWSLLMISRSPKVKPFKRWMTHEVLPSIRKTGGYAAADTNIALPDRKTLAQWVVEAETRAELAEAKALELSVPASAWNELAEAAGDYAVSDAAKVLSRDPAVNIKERALFQYMSSIGWVFKRQGRWKAYRTQLETGRLAEKVGKPFWHESRGEWVNGEPTVRITPKGLAELHKRLGGTGQLALAAAS
ncbi:hypothetical protein PBI_ESTAVE1_48 [Mycobacterium phage Estave1]|uniref:Antirepressor n=2 Tax=Cheoctovirus TaxID=1623281 RepID=A0A0K2FNW0_9CAUD|nr:anti-repressor Ant [Mycobacterium phage Estave1]YP_009214403.1 anti-repressor Ant [Mycobacterium phage PopTart]AIM40438.1 hypothetical protein PBI_ESTAVE1_48 [Mycobacterium phage Estave1]ALA48590.1 antirepressor [Mycobacterium phage PopTart]AQY55550.1 antirepressor [Mycobacterium phage SassyB]